MVADALRQELALHTLERLHGFVKLAFEGGLARDR
jgi:hypothetical protein